MNRSIKTIAIYTLVYTTCIKMQMEFIEINDQYYYQCQKWITIKVKNLQGMNLQKLFFRETKLKKKHRSEYELVISHPSGYELSFAKIKLKIVILDKNIVLFY